MARKELLRPRHAAFVKKALGLVVFAAIAFGAYKLYLAKRPALPEYGADLVAYEYLVALRVRNYQRAYELISPGAQAGTTPQDMDRVCGQTFRSIDNWNIQEPAYSPTHTSATVSVTLYYHSAWSPDDAAQVSGDVHLKLAGEAWRLAYDLPFITAIQKGRDTQMLAK